MAMILSSCSCSNCARADVGVGAADADLRVATILSVVSKVVVDAPRYVTRCFGWRGVCFGPRTRLPVRLKAAVVTNLGLG